MTREEAREYLKNKKVFVRDKSKEVQDKLREIGFTTTVDFIPYDKPFLYLTSILNIGYNSDSQFFYKNKRREINPEDILDITIDEEQRFEPYERVLWRDGINDYWRAGIYSHLRGNRHYIIGTGYVRYNDVISYKDNEDKINKVTTD